MQISSGKSVVAPQSRLNLNWKGTRLESLSRKIEDSIDVAVERVIKFLSARTDDLKVKLGTKIDPIACSSSLPVIRTRI